jgi:hypothetical protein
VGSMSLSEKNKLILSVAGGLLLLILIEKYFIKKRKVLDEKKSNIDKRYYEYKFNDIKQWEE